MWKAFACYSSLSLRGEPDLSKTVPRREHNCADILPSLMTTTELEENVISISETREHMRRQREILRRAPATGDSAAANRAEVLVDMLAESLAGFRAQRDMAFRRLRRPRATSRSREDHWPGGGAVSNQE